MFIFNMLQKLDLKNNVLCFTVILSFIFPFVSSSQEQFDEFKGLFLPPQKYVIYMPFDSIVIDGKDTETSWKQAEWSNYFVDIEGPQKMKPTYQTRVKMLWDKNNLYVFAELEEPHIWSYYKVHDQIVFQENDFEIFIDPEMKAQNYFEFELNAANTLFDLFLARPYRNGVIPLITWNAPGFKSAVSLYGSLNNPRDVDQSWTVEIAIPFEALKLGLKNPVPIDGQNWKLDFSRVEWKTDLIDGKYQKRKDEKTERLLSEDNWVWNPTGEINMHVPERWGIVQFSLNKVNEEKVAFKMPDNEELNKYLWMIYYKQYAFRKANGIFAKSLSELSVPSVIQISDSKKVQINLLATELQFTIHLSDGRGLKLSLNDNGILLNTSKVE